MNILITGASGQLGQTLLDKIEEGRFDGHNVLSADITGAPNTLDIPDKGTVE